MLNPRCREKIDSPGGMAGDKALFEHIRLGDPHRVPAECFLEGNQFADRETEHGGLPEPFERPGGIAGEDDTIMPAESEQIIQVSGDDKIEIQEQYRALEISKPWSP